MGVFKSIYKFLMGVFISISYGGIYINFLWGIYIYFNFLWGYLYQFLMGNLMLKFDSFLNYNHNYIFNVPLIFGN